MGAQSATPVLVVDDDEDLRATLRDVLEDAGHPVAEAACALEALAYLRATPAGHVVLLDFLMPGGDARPLLRAVKLDATLGRHRYVLIPALPPTRLPEDDRRLIGEVCAEVLRKPFELDDLLRAVDTPVGRLVVGARHLRPDGGVT